MTKTSDKPTTVLKDHPVFKLSSVQELKAVHKALPTMTLEEKVRALAAIEAFEEEQWALTRRKSLLEFIKSVDPSYKIGKHHRILAEKLEKAAAGELDRIAVSIGPRFGKSYMLSYYFPAWFMGNFPTQKLLIASHTADLAVDFGRKVRNLIATEEYKRIFPGVTLAQDSKSAGRWTTNKGGEFFAVGVGGAVAGRGADLLIVDDPFSEQDVLAGNYEVFDKGYDWYAYGARTRLMPGGRVVVLHTRWAKNDLIGRLIEEAAKKKDSDQWDYTEFPAIINENSTDPDNPEKSLWPEQWSLESLRRTRATMPSFQWLAQYQQSPTAQSGAIVKSAWWRRWADTDPPPCTYVIMALDAAQEANKRADYSALATFGIFEIKDEETERPISNIILLNCINKRVEFPDLKKMVLNEYRLRQPDNFIVEKKSNGAALAQEFRRMGIPLQEFTPSRGSADNPNTKMARLQSVADIVKSGLVWAPETQWADDFIEQVNDFPAGQHDDMVDVLAMTLMRFRQGGFITLPIDEDFEDDGNIIPRKRLYYSV